MNKHYLGDGVYVGVDDQTGDLVLTTEDGIRVTNRVVLEAQVYYALERYAKDAWPEALIRLSGVKP